MSRQDKIGPETLLPLDKFATLLRCHPRTILRKITGERNAHPYWTEGFNPAYSIEYISRKFHVKPDRLIAVINGADKLLKGAEAAAMLKLDKPCFVKRQYPKLIKEGGVVLFSRHDITNWHVEHWVRDRKVRA